MRKTFIFIVALTLIFTSTLYARSFRNKEDGQTSTGQDISNDADNLDQTTNIHDETDQDQVDETQSNLDSETSQDQDDETEETDQDQDDETEGTDQDQNDETEETDQDQDDETQNGEIQNDDKTNEGQCGEQQTRKTHQNKQKHHKKAAKKKMIYFFTKNQRLSTQKILGRTEN
ncbi:hypothetical protein ABPG74_017010 [Tetrahymena malaccensis]